MIPKHLNPLLIEVGEILYGRRFRSALAEDLGVSDWTMRRWVSGEAEVPKRVYRDLLPILMENIREACDVAVRLERAVKAVAEEETA